MEKKYIIRGFREPADLPVFYDEKTYSFEEASLKAKEYLVEKALLSKVIIYEQEDGEDEKAAKLLCRNRFGRIQEIINQWLK